MEYILTKKDKQLVRLVEKIIKKWKKNLQIDPLWHIEVVIVDDEEMEGAIARVNSSSSEYFTASIEITNGLLYLPEDKFLSTIDDFVCHELVHLVSIDFYRTALLAVGENHTLAKELKYRYEQFTSRLQKAFVEMEKQVVKSKEQPLKLIEEKEEE